MVDSQQELISGLHAENQDLRKQVAQLSANQARLIEVISEGLAKDREWRKRLRQIVTDLSNADAVTEESQ